MNGQDGSWDQPQGIMNSQSTPDGSSASSHMPATSNAQRGLGLFAVFMTVLTVVFAQPILAWINLSIQDDFYSHLPFIPVISAFLIWSRRKTWGDAGDQRTSAVWAGLFLAAGCVTLVLHGLGRHNPQPPPNDALAPALLAYVCLVLSGFLWLIGAGIARRAIFPLGFLFLMVPLPTGMTHWLAVSLQHLSADAASTLIQATGTPLFRQGLTFHLPGIVLTVEEECSGIRSTLVLFITSLLASHLFLRTTRRRAALILLVVPLAILRNGLRICTIAWLCVRVSPDMIYSAIHRRGGPIFLALSLIPFFAVLLWLRRQEKMCRLNGMRSGLQTGSESGQ
jgi:exosortase C (VPDSG-CTERM-specific)